MRCKRCGEILDPKDLRCPVCGKTVNPPRKKAPAQKPGETNIKLPQLDKFTHAYSRDAASSRLLQLATIVAVIAAIVLVVMVFVGVGDLKEAVRDLKLTADAQLQALQNQTPAAEVEIQDPQPQTDPEEETTGEEPGDTRTEEEPLPLRQQQTEAVLTLYAAADGAYATSAMTPGTLDDRADAWVGTSLNGGERKTGAVWVLEGSGDRVGVDLTESYGGGENLVEMTLSWDMAGDTFGDLGSPVCIWEYRVEGSAWESLPTNYLNPIGGGCELEMTADAVKLLLAQYSQMELRCHVTLSHPAGGTVQILLNGIILDAEGLALSDSLLD